MIATVGVNAFQCVAWKFDFTMQLPAPVLSMQTDTDAAAPIPSYGLLALISRPPTSPWARYGVALALLAVAVGLRWLVLPVESRQPFVTILPAAILAFYWCGFGPGVVAVLTGAAAALYLFLPPHFQWVIHAEALWSLGSFFVSAMLAGWLVTRLNTVNRQLSSTTSALAAQEQQYREVVRDLAEFVCRFEPSGRIIFVNDAFCDAFGVSERDVVGSNWHPMVLPDDLARLTAALGTLTPKRPTVLIENRFVRSDGAVRWGQFTNRAWFDADGKLLGLQSVGRDITDQRDLQAALDEARNDLQDLYDNAPCGYHSLDARGRYLRVNDTELKWIGRTREEALGKLGPRDFFTEEGREVFDRALTRFLADGHIEGVEVDLVKRDGSVRRMLVNSIARTDDQGRFMYSRSVMQDITVQSHAVAALQRLTMEQAALLDNDLVAVMKLRNRRIVWHNRGVRRLLGYTEAELNDLPLVHFYPDQEGFDQQGLEAYAVLRAGGVYRTERSLVRRDGTAVWVATQGMMTDQAKGESLWVMLDRTAWKQADDARLLSAELTAENRSLQEAARLKSNFLASMSHELHTPLNGILGFAYLLGTPAVRDDPVKFNDHLAKVTSSGKRLLALIDMVLEKARADSKQLEISQHEVQVASVLESVCSSFTTAIAERGLMLTMTCDPTLGTVMLDPLRLRQVLGALLSNAIKFNRPGGSIEVNVRSDRPGWLELTVTDTGVGIAEVDRERIFEMFTQVDQGLDRKSEGAGLGLALSRQLVEAQGGTLVVTSTLGQGSRFQVALPLLASMLPSQS